MAIDKLVAPLLRVPLFAGLKPLQLTEIARQAERISFRPGGTITDGGPARRRRLSDRCRRGRPSVSGDREQAIEPGSLVGEIAMLAEHVYGATVMAAVACMPSRSRAARCTSRCATTRRWPSISRGCWLSG